MVNEIAKTCWQVCTLLSVKGRQNTRNSKYTKQDQKTRAIKKGALAKERNIKIELNQFPYQGSIQHLPELPAQGRQKHC